jgi:Ca-activated chloride channel family protein
MIEGIKAALDFAHDPERLRFVTFLTDGYIGNESQILGEIHTRIVQHENASRIFSFGVGSAPNRFLMDRMAKIGRGAVAYLSLKDDGAKVMDAFFSRVSHPVLSDVRIDFGDMQVSDVLPPSGVIPDLFVGRPVIVTGKYTGTQPSAIKITGRAAGNHVQSTINVDPNQPAAHPAIASIWARMHIAELMDQATYSNNAELPQQIKAIALNYNLMSAYTSFIAVDSSQRTAGESGTTVHVAVPVPEGVKYETTVAEH